MYPIALYLYLKNGRKPTTEEIREYQAMRLGDTVLKETVALELMPLPAIKTDESTWIYGKLGIPGLATRSAYLKTYKPERVQKLRELFHTHQPTLAIFFSLTYLPDWKEIIGTEPVEITTGMYFAKAGGTTYCIIPHSVARGMSYARLYEFAERVRGEIENAPQD